MGRASPVSLADIEDTCGEELEWELDKMAADAHATRNRLRSVEQDHDTPPWTNAGRHTSSDSPFTAALRIHDLNPEAALCGSDRGEIADARPLTASKSAGFDRREELAKMILSGPAE